MEALLWRVSVLGQAVESGKDEENGENGKNGRNGKNWKNEKNGKNGENGKYSVEQVRLSQRQGWLWCGLWCLSADRRDGLSKEVTWSGALWIMGEE